MYGFRDEKEGIMAKVVKMITMERDGRTVYVKATNKKAYIKDGWKVKR